MSQNHSSGTRKLFGHVAVEKGFVSEFQVDNALDCQKTIREEGARHKLIGMVLLEMGALDTTELIDVLKVLEVPRKQASSL
jgi:hypothetical protein